MATAAMAGVDMGVMGRLRDERLITINRHPELPLLILNYTPRTQYERRWTPETLMCRGLVVEEDGTIVARPFPKFFNWEEHESNPELPRINWNQDFVATEKMDGALLVQFRYAGRWIMATRGSFVSPQSDEARAIWRDNGYREDALRGDDTYLYEIISPKTKVVVDYRGVRELVLLEIVETLTGESPRFKALGFAAGQIGCRPVERAIVPCLHPTTLVGFCDEGEPNREGVVIRFADGLRVKAKFAEYKRLHRLVTGVNSKVVWEYLRDGRSMDELLDRVPDELEAWVRDTAGEIRVRFREEAGIADRIFIDASERLGDAPRKEYAAEFIREKRYSGVLFRMLDNKPFDDLLWKMVRPETAKPFRVDEEE